ncbi:MAG: hypothetical protein DRJ64_05320 [Thermoprotei archaeon]|nr:MAG: hypothetical protein DRJ64_05320 [Thermoprotei archaeon]
MVVGDHFYILIHLKAVLELLRIIDRIVVRKEKSENKDTKAINILYEERLKKYNFLTLIFGKKFLEKFKK